MRCTQNLQKMLREETTTLYSDRVDIDFSGYNTAIDGYIIIACKKEYPQLKNLGYEEVTDREKEIYNLISKYAERVLYKVSEEILERRHVAVLQ